MAVTVNNTSASSAKGTFTPTPSGTFKKAVYGSASAIHNHLAIWESAFVDRAEFHRRTKNMVSWDEANVRTERHIKILLELPQDWANMDSPMSPLVSAAPVTEDLRASISWCVTHIRQGDTRFSSTTTTGIFSFFMQLVT
jgi:hypothetical protein